MLVPAAAVDWHISQDGPPTANRLFRIHPKYLGFGQVDTTKQALEVRTSPLILQDILQHGFVSEDQPGCRQRNAHGRTSCDAL